jgi:GT2 family glycosyltransferase
MGAVTIVIVNWNAGRQLRDCVQSIIIHELTLVSRIIVVDNASTDGSERTLEDIPQVELIQLKKNAGFARACNLGSEHVNTEFILFLNPDTRLFRGSIEQVIDFMRRTENQNIGICGIRLVDENGGFTTCAARFPTLKIMACKILGLSYISPNIFPSHFMTPKELMASGPVDQVIGAFFMIRKNVLDLCGGFDERFFVYFEEVDLSLRAKNLGYSSYFLSDVTAFHAGGGCTQTIKATRLFYSIRSRILYAEKHYTVESRLFLILLTLFELPLRLGQGIFRWSWSDIKNTISAYYQIIIYFIFRE